MDRAALSSHLFPAGKLKAYVTFCVAFFFAAIFLIRSQAGSPRPLSTLSQPPNILVIPQQTHISSKESPSSCPRDWPDHLRVKSPPVAFPWVAVNEQAKDVKLLGPDGSEVKLKPLGTLSLLNNTAYNFEAQLPGRYQLLVSGEPVSEFYSHHADCDCPWGFNKFLAEYECPADMAARVRKNMIRWPVGSITEDMFFGYNGRPAVLSNPEVVQFAIVKNKVYCKSQNGQYCPFVNAEGASIGHLHEFAQMIHSVLRKVTLPDVVFYLDHVDNPVMEHYAFQPTFVASSTDFHGDLLLPTLTMMNAKYRGNDVLAATSGDPWERRAPVGYFMGRMTGQPQAYAEGAYILNPRCRAREIAMQRPDLLDVNLVIDEETSLDDKPHVQYLVDRGVLSRGAQPKRNGGAKFILDLPGNSAAWRLGERFGDGAVTIKSQTPWNEYWHYLLEPGKNVLFVGDYLEDLVDTVEYARARDADMRCMARAAQLTSFTRMRQEDILCYTALSLQHLATKFRFRPNLTDDYIEIPRESRDPAMCKCSES